MTVGFIHHYGLGDNILAFRALYECKRFYRCRLIVFGNALMMRLLQCCSFVDKIIDIHVLDKESALTIKKYHCDYLILTNPKSSYISDLRICQTTIITGTKIPSLFSSYCKTVPIFLLPQYRKMNVAEILCVLVRKINPTVYDAEKTKLENLINNPHLQQADSKECLTDTLPYSSINYKIQTSEEHQTSISAFLQKAFHAACSPFYLIAINPFCIAAQYSLPSLAWLELIDRVSQIPSCKVLVVTYPTVHEEFIQDIKHFDTKSTITNGSIKQSKNILLNRITLFQNNYDVLNLAEILSRVSLLISPSTGAIHLASNLRIPSIGLYSHKDTRKWATYDRRYVIINKPKEELDSRECHHIISETLHTLESLIASSSLTQYADNQRR
ncbi:glycosyltransferase family 9 protein [Helicobacter sp. MIT 14-3879]|uniref:glycosyltransferase family 9 protein n=1 Tax=Helicobacter sp. MIT 14-3879 TaxID=2040649 RepID=UPI000E1F1B6D|nr:glycosyltransferase family 9 protein [Helicobacter sp. MIT 14-3879]RDU61458.1 hypothetical protein CQA44_08885 [Helicobacter sp. MIT 14-3879]